MVASVSTGFSASIDFGKITFTRENNGGDKTWTVLNFTVADPTIDGKRYLDRRSIRFTLDTDRTNRYVRTDIPLNDRFLLRKKWLKTGKLNNESTLYVGGRPLKGPEISDVNSLTTSEKQFISWIIINASDLIRMALESGKIKPESSIRAWEKLVRNDTFERQTRKTFYPYLGSNFSDVKKSQEHSKTRLKTIQKQLKDIKLYSGSIDGVIGPQTRAAIRKFEKQNGLFPNAFLSANERNKLTQLSKKQQSGVAKTQTASSQIVSKEAERIKQLEARVLFLSELSGKRLKIINELRKNDNSVLQKLETEINVLKRNNEYFANLASDRLVEISKLKAKVAVQPDDGQLKKRADFLGELARKRLKRIADLVKEVENLEKKTQEVKDLQQKTDFLDELAAKRLKRVNELTKQINSYKLDNQNVIKLSNQQAEEIDKQSYKLIEKDNKIISLEQKITELTTVLPTFDWETQKGKLERALLEQQSLNGVLQSKLDALEVKNKNTTDELLVLQGDLSSAKKELDSVKKENKDLTDIVANLETEIAALDELSARENKSKFKLSEDWSTLERWVPAQQLRFCSILSEYSVAADEAAASMNQLKQNAAVTLRDENMQALLLPSPSGANSLFQNWIAKVEKVFVINLDNGGIGAGIVLRTPCEVTIGSGAQVVNEAGSFKIEEFRAIALPDEPIFKQLEQLSNGDTVIINGGFITYGDGKDLSKFITNVDGIKKRLVESERPDNAPDYFVDITYLSQL